MLACRRVSMSETTCCLVWMRRASSVQDKAAGISGGLLLATSHKVMYVPCPQLEAEEEKD